MYFDKFPPSYYITPSGEKILVTDLVRAVRFPQSILDEEAYFIQYIVKDNETPEIISDKVYKSSAYHWLIMVVNQKYDVWNDFPKDESSVRKAAEVKYSDINGIHHYEDESGSIVDEYTVPNIPVTNIEYEIEENEKKRAIKVVDPVYLSNFVSTYMQLISE